MSRISPRQQARLDKQRALKRAYYNVFKGRDGEAVLADLQNRFYDVDLTRDDEHSSAVKVGGHRVVLYIKRLISAGEKGSE